MNFIDLRSDTATRPTPGMKEAMAIAPLGDDCFGEDPTVNALEEKTATIFGKEAGLFCPTGTMTNQIAIKVLTQPGHEVICDKTAHIYNYEGGGLSFNSGVSVRPVNGDRGRFKPDDILENINPGNDNYAITSVVALENTSNKGGGSFYSLEAIKALSDTARKQNLAMHLDGARIFNALAETGDSPKETGSLFDTISICLSKGLGAPVGSVLVSTKENIKKARRIRRVLGGGMRQAGVIAAAGIYALDHHIVRLKEDHKHAKAIGQAISALPFVEELFPVDTNIVLFRLAPTMERDKFIALLVDKNIKAVAFGKQTVRMVTHLDVSPSMVDQVISVLSSLR